MIAPKHNSLCRQAERYYYDFLGKEDYDLIPKPIINHIKQCQNCQEQLNQLEGVLSQAEDNGELGQRQVGPAITVMLKLHFAYVGKRLTCETVRPFLPTLLDPALEIRIPTPITAHLDNCQQCSQDFEAIRGLNLTSIQLGRLSQCLAEKPAEDGVNCSQAPAVILPVVLMDFRETNAEVLKHLCTCPNCRKALYQYREVVRTDSSHYKGPQEEFPCKEISATDIFDYVMPYGLDPADDRYAKFRKSLTSHLQDCPVCLAKMQELHNTLYGIAERPESEVVTIYHVDDSAKAEILSESDDLYAGFPMRVDVTTHEDEVKAKQLAPAVSFATVLKQKVATMNLKPVVKASVAAAAVILVTVALLLNTPSAKAVTIEGIYKAIEKIKNVHISSFVPDKTEPIQEKWVSQTLNIYMTKTGKELVMWDPAKKIRKTKQLGTDSVEITLLSDDLIATAEKKITGSLGLMPFYYISEIPSDAKWKRITSEDMVVTVKGTEVYDLIWTDKTRAGSTLFWKCRFFVHPKTSLPQRVERYRRFAGDNEYTLSFVDIIEYLEDSEIQRVIKDCSF
ncbi:MAG: hypothetical protein ACYTEW_17965 [Planctomycetota bacterium]|jgi:hypothetical protein